MNTLNDQNGLFVYRLLEFPNESAESWPIADRAHDSHPIPLLRLLRALGRGTASLTKIA
jgi:hypothetical protein